MRFTAFALVLQLAALVLFVLSVAGAGSIGSAGPLGPSSPAGTASCSGSAAVIVGLLVPLALQVARPARTGAPGLAALTAALVLVGGFLVKYVIIAAGQLVS